MPTSFTPRSDTEAEQGIAAAANIRSIPTIMAFREGRTRVQPGPARFPPLSSRSSSLRSRALDMDEVRKQIAEQTASAE